jgi:DNA-binding transcriptional MerR regulator
MDEELFFPTQAAKVLGISPPTLRRYAQAWETAIGPLPRAPGGGRLWPQAALARLKAARELAQREGIPLEEALLRVKGEAPPVATAHPEEEAPVLLREVLARIEAVEEEVRALRRAIETLMKKTSKPWWRFWG